MKTFKKHLQEAGVAFIDTKGRRVDFHSLRHTLATNMALAGTAPCIAMEIMRHSDMRLTTKTYTDAVMLPVYDAITKLPSFAPIENGVSKASQIASQILFRTGQNGATTVNRSPTGPGTQVMEAETLSPDLSVLDMTGPDRGKGSERQDLNLRHLGPKPSALPS